MSRVFLLISVILFILAFAGAAGIGGHPYGHLNWSDLVALGLAFYAAASLV